MTKKVVLIGDVMLDISILGIVARVAPEAPVGVISEVSRTENLGGAGNVFSNLVAAGIEPYFITAVGNDDEGIKVYDKVVGNIKFQRPCRVFVDESRPTTVKTRVYAYTHHIRKEILITRIDKENTNPVISTQLINNRVSQRIAEADYILFSDYSKGVITEELIDLIKTINPHAKLIADFKSFNSRYKNFYIITPNEIDVGKGLEAFDIAKAYRSLYGINYPVITRGNKGVTFLDDEGNGHNIEASNDVAIDVTGAGDTFIAYLTASLCKGYTLLDAVNIGVKAAGISVTHEGIYTVKGEEVYG